MKVVYCGIVSMRYPMTIRGKVIQGSGRGRSLGTPTINVDPTSAPGDLQHGVYACFVTLDRTKMMGALHYGPRPVFHDSLSLEVHILDAMITEVPPSIEIEIIGRIRDIRHFASKEELFLRIQTDITEVRGMLQGA